MTSLLSRNFIDIVFADHGPLWTLQRKLGYKSLMLYGEDSGSLEETIVKQCKDMIVRLRDANGRPVDAHVEFGKFLRYTD